MIKMIIRMNNDRIIDQGKYSVEQLYAAIDRIFVNKGMSRVDTDRGVEYIGPGKSTDFAYFGKIMLGLKDQAWFMDNAEEWLYCDNEDSEDVSVFNEENLLAHYGHNIIA